MWRVFHGAVLTSKAKQKLLCMLSWMGPTEAHALISYFFLK